MTLAIKLLSLVKHSLTATLLLLAVQYKRHIAASTAAYVQKRADK